MNKTISINLGGSVFNIEEEAYGRLKIYLEKIKLNFINDPSMSEIMDDIEMRIAELFTERMNERKNVVVPEDVDRVVEVLGKPEDFGSGEDSQASAGRPSASDIRHNNRKFYRDEEDAVLGGVCSGFSHFLGWDPILIRLIMVALAFLSFGTSIIGYIIVWSIVPAAYTTAEKLQMRGEPVTVENISKYTREGVKQAESFTHSAISKMRDSSIGFGSALASFIKKIAAVFMILMGFGLLVGLFMLLMFSETTEIGDLGSLTSATSRLVYDDNSSLWLFVTGVVLCMLIPAISLLYIGLKILFNSQRNIKGLGLSLLGLFIIGIMLCSYGGIKTAHLFKNHMEFSEEHSMTGVTDTLYLDAMADPIFHGVNRRHGNWTDLCEVKGDSIYFGEPIHLSFEYTSDKSYSFDIVQRSNGKTVVEAGELANNIFYDYQIKGDSLLLAQVFTIPQSDKYRGQHIEVIVYVPQGRCVSFGKQINSLTYYRSHKNDVLRMTKHGLVSQEDEERIRIEEMEEDERRYKDSLEDLIRRDLNEN
jgi:phage shock protein PspC (stress-responsive transcriptional regulator)